MEDILESFNQDLQDIENTLSLLGELDRYKSVSYTSTHLESTDLFIKSAVKIKEDLFAGRKGMVKIPGIYILYIAGRFEDYVRTLFEELSIRIAKAHTHFIRLPKSMQTALIKESSVVISEYKKYGFEENARDSFIENLYLNVHKNDLSKINYKCISATQFNMRPQVLNDLFKKIGLTNIWEKIGEQSRIKGFFETDESSKSTKESQEFLENFMSQRNKIAHPSGDLSWPSLSSILTYIEYFKELSKVLLEISEVYEKKVIKELKSQSTN